MTDGGLVGLRRQLGHRGGSGSHERCRHDGMQRGETRRRMPGKGGGIFRINDEDKNKIYNENTREYANAIAILRSALRIRLPDGAASWITKEQIQQEKGLPPLPLVSSRAPLYHSDHTASSPDLCQVIDFVSIGRPPQNCMSSVVNCRSRPSTTASRQAINLWHESHRTHIMTCSTCSKKVGG